MAEKSKLSRLLTTGNPGRLDAALDLAAVPFDHLAFGKPGEVSDMIDALRGA
jgi:hypothetical protein